MTEGYPRSAWYDQTLPKGSESPVPAKKKKRTGAKVTAICLSVLVLLVASVYVFTDGFGYQARQEWIPSGFRNTPGASTERNDEGGDLPEDFRSFFENRFEGLEDDTPVGSNMARVPGNPEVKLQTVSAEGRPELTLQELYAGRIDSIVGVRAYYERSYGYGWGSGIIMTPDGYILTNQHIIDEADSAEVVLSDGSEYEAMLIGEDTKSDIAILKIEAEGLVPAVFGDSGALSVGDRVVAIGNPLGDELTGTMTDGIISAINRDIQANGRRMTLLQTNAALNEGSSGGPLFNIYGQVIGITNMKMTNRYSEVTVEGIGFAIPIAVVKPIADQLIAGGEVVGSWYGHHHHGSHR